MDVCYTFVLTVIPILKMGNTSNTAVNFPVGGKCPDFNGTHCSQTLTHLTLQTSNTP